MMCIYALEQTCRDSERRHCLLVARVLLYCTGLRALLQSASWSSLICSTLWTALAHDHVHLISEFAGAALAAQMVVVCFNCRATWAHGGLSNRLSTMTLLLLV